MTSFFSSFFPLFFQPLFPCCFSCFSGSHRELPLLTSALLSTLPVNLPPSVTCPVAAAPAVCMCVWGTCLGSQCVFRVMPAGRMQ